MLGLLRCDPSGLPFVNMIQSEDVVCCLQLQADVAHVSGIIHISQRHIQAGSRDGWCCTHKICDVTGREGQDHMEGL
jgi:hypothetical protein